MTRVSRYYAPVWRVQPDPRCPQNLDNGDTTFPAVLPTYIYNIYAVLPFHVAANTSR